MTHLINHFLDLCYDSVPQLMQSAYNMIQCVTPGRATMSIEYSRSLVVSLMKIKIVEICFKT